MQCQPIADLCRFRVGQRPQDFIFDIEKIGFALYMRIAGIKIFKGNRTLAQRRKHRVHRFVVPRIPGI